MLIAFGFAGAARSVWIFLALAILFALIYAPTIRSEEEFLRGKFGDFDEYSEAGAALVSETHSGFDRGEVSRAVFPATFT